VLLIAGCDGIGLAVLRVFGLGPSDSLRWQRGQAILVGAMALAIVLYPLALINLTSMSVMRFLAGVIVGLGLANIFRLIRKWARRPRVAGDTARRFGGWQLLVMLTVTAAAVMALGPVTDADSLDYHMGVPIALLRTGGMPAIPEWVHSRLAGNIEVLNALGLAVGAEQFGALLQLGGLVSIVTLLLFAESASGDDQAATLRPVAAAAAVAAPLVVGLISQKPQLMPIAMTTLGLALLIYPSRRQLSRGAALMNHAFVCVLVMSASQAKLSYLLGGGVVGLIALGVMARRQLLWPALAVAATAALIVLLPPVLWKQHVFHGGLIDSFIKPFPGQWPASDALQRRLIGLRRGPIQLAFYVLFDYRPARLTTIIGPAGAILLTGLRPGRDRWLLTAAFAAATVAMASFFIEPISSRYYLEPYFWLLMVLALQANQAPFARVPWMTWPVAVQALLTLTLFVYGAATLLPGALTARWRDQVMDRSANGYRVMKWADSVLPSDAVLLTDHRSVALAPRDVVPLDWTEALNVNSPAAIPFLERIRARGVTHLLVLGSMTHMARLDGCVGALVAGPGEGRFAARNPFAPSATYPAWIFEFKSQSLPGCAIGN
jgi:hypothetical protein